jgi:hypothetical protein
MTNLQSSGLQNRSGTGAQWALPAARQSHGWRTQGFGSEAGCRSCQSAAATSTQVLVATKVARLCRARLFANRGRMPGFAD